LNIGRERLDLRNEDPPPSQNPLRKIFPWITAEAPRYEEPGSQVAASRIGNTPNKKCSCISVGKDWACGMRIRPHLKTLSEEYPLGLQRKPPGMRNLASRCCVQDRQHTERKQVAFHPKIQKKKRKEKKDEGCAQ
jgi:hypothetical protein